MNSGRYELDESKSLSVMAVELFVKLDELMNQYMKIVQKEFDSPYMNDEEIGTFKEMMNSGMDMIRDMEKWAIAYSYKMEEIDHKLDKLLLAAK